jgi:hypothetical protein
MIDFIQSQAIYHIGLAFSRIISNLSVPLLTRVYSKEASLTCVQNFPWYCKSRRVWRGGKHPVKCIIRSFWVAPDVSSHGKYYYSYSFSHSYFVSCLGGAEMLCFPSVRDMKDEK